MELSQKNDKDLLPIFVDRSRFSLKLTFASAALRNAAVDSGYIFHDRTLFLVLPHKEQTHRTITVNVYGLPLAEPDDAVKKWLEQQYQVMDSLGFIAWSGTSFFNSGDMNSTQLFLEKR